MRTGFTLIEVVVAVGVFALLAVIGSSLLFNILRGSKKAAAISSIRSEGAVVMDALNSHLRFARSIDACSSSSVQVTTVNDNTLTFACLADAANGLNYIASGSARLTTPVVTVTNCNVFTCCSGADCTAPYTDKLNKVKINFILSRKGAVMTEDTASMVFSSEVGLRNQ